MFWENVIAGSVSGLVSGGIVGFTLYFLQRSLNRREVVNINFSKSKKRLPSDIFDHVKPGMGLAKVLESFGSADVYFDEVNGFFEKDFNPVKTNSYLFKFLNAHLRVTSRDKAVIDTVTVFVAGDDNTKSHRIRLPFQLRDGNNGYLGHTLLTHDFLENVKNHLLFRSMRERLFGIEIYAGFGTGYMSYTYFGYFVSNVNGYQKDERPEYFLGETIHGVCISRNIGFSVAIGEYE